MALLRPVDREGDKPVVGKREQGSSGRRKGGGEKEEGGRKKGGGHHGRRAWVQAAQPGAATRHVFCQPPRAGLLQFSLGTPWERGRSGLRTRTPSLLPQSVG